MKPFDFQLAIDGEYVVTANGVDVDILHYDDFTEHFMIKIKGNEKPETISWQDAKKTFFMKPTIVTKYLNVYKSSSNRGNEHPFSLGLRMFDTKEAAASAAGLVVRVEEHDSYVKTIEVEVEL